MANLLFIIFPQQSHHNAAFRVATIFKKRGHSITYAAIQKLKSSVELNSFQFFEIAPEDDFYPFITEVTSYKKRSPLKSLQNGTRFVTAVEKRLNNKDLFSNIISAVKPDLILIDGAYKLFSLQLSRSTIPYIFVETTVSTLRTVGIPPLNSDLPFRNNWYARSIAALAWSFYLNPFKPSFTGAFRRYAKTIGYPLSDIDFKRYFLPGFRSIAEINTSFLDFDYPRTLPDNHYYVAPAKIQPRKETSFSYNYQIAVDTVKRQDRSVVYCSLGTMASRYHNHEKFLHRVLSVFKANPQWVLIVCVENDQLRRDLNRIRASNTFVVKKVPQLELLSNYADAMIHHGGLNSINECIQTGTPMLVCPGSKDLDQPGNGARIAYHGIGIKCSLTAHESRIQSGIEQLLTNPIFKENIENLYRKIVAGDSSENQINIIESRYLKNIHDNNRSAITR